LEGVGDGGSKEVRRARKQGLWQVTKTILTQKLDYSFFNMTDLATCANDFLTLGLSIMMGKGTSSASRHAKKTESRCFNAHFGVEPAVVAAVWSTLVYVDEVISDYVKQKHLLWTLLFLKSYATFDVITCQVGADEKTVRKWVWYIIAAVSDLADAIVSILWPLALLRSRCSHRRLAYFCRQIDWEDRKVNDVGATCLVTVDGTYFSINEPKPWDSKWFSHKHDGPGVRYEFAICIQTGQIVWINGPFPCGPNTDIVIFRQALIHQLEWGEMVEADNGYGGEPQFIRMRDEPNVSTIQFIAKARARARHEAVNGRMRSLVS
jgi:hypothetical protein